MGTKPLKRQPGSDKLWLNEESNLYWCSTMAHRGRVTQILRGPECLTPEDALASLNHYMRHPELI